MARASVPGRFPWIPSLLAAAVHALTAMVFVFPWTVGAGVASAGLGAACGALLGASTSYVRPTRDGQQRGRLTTWFGVGLLLFLVSISLPSVVASAATAVGPSAALTLAECVRFFFAAASTSFVLRMLSERRRAFAALEVAAVGVAFAELLVAHRNGAINRPFEVSDPILATGGDPTVAFLVIGGVATAAVVVLLLRERSWVRAALHLGLMLALLVAGVALTDRVGLMPSPPPTGQGLGLRGEPKEGQGRGGGGGGGRRDNDDLEFRDNYDSPANQVPVGVVLFHDDYSAPNGIYYLRQGAFSQYNGRRLVQSTRRDVDRDLAPSFPTQSPVVIDGAPPSGMHRATLETTVAMLAEHTKPFALEAPVRLEPTRNPNPSRFKRVYRVTSAVLTGDLYSLLGAKAGDARWSPEQLAHYTAAPEDGRYKALAERVLRERTPIGLEDEPIVKALALTGYLGAEGKYSLRSRHAGADDPTASFLFGDLTGYCVHFAHAAAYLMRSVGLPARVATGYAIDEASRQGGSAMMVTGQASHAWPEVYLDGIGWVIVDVSPETVLDPPASPPDADLQRLLAELLREEKPIASATSALPSLARSLRAALRVAGLALLGLLAASLLGLVFGKAWRRMAPRFADDAALARLAYRATLDRLSEVDVRRQAGESREAFARRVAREVPSLGLLTAEHVRATFGRKQPDTVTLRAHARAANAEIARAYSAGKRALGLLVPWTWLRSR